MDKKGARRARWGRLLGWGALGVGVACAARQPPARVALALPPGVAGPETGDLASSGAAGAPGTAGAGGSDSGLAAPSEDVFLGGEVAAGPGSDDLPDVPAPRRPVPCQVSEDCSLDAEGHIVPTPAGQPRQRLVPCVDGEQVPECRNGWCVVMDYGC